ncbi:2OG-Fe(II) oxygenase [Alteromonas pelagimontana]|uniref:2OG-Fe(II) oxygenase n=1 Tax=Alteromonas pelagimontana TaxID=1858656 RepID=A0A6M4MGQ1_9ALTE|nr:2OG-Fe(II) oxygenase [Alteromonas pelagimontana]QJR82374.1 2OG-Fe(II) oxygenase [Alteromonas pelagimontana]
MTGIVQQLLSPCEGENNVILFEKIVEDLCTKGYSIQHQALPTGLSQQLSDCQHRLSDHNFTAAGIGRQQEYQKNSFVRTDEICWIDGTSEAGRRWLLWCEELKAYLNRRLFLGLFSFESHFAHYAPGSFYKRHTDAFKGESNRMLSLVTYLNADWQLEDGGELVLYRDEADREGINVLPRMGTVAIFLSEDFPHEVKPAKRDRYSVAGWFRINTTHGNKVDPPR